MKQTKPTESTKPMKLKPHIAGIAGIICCIIIVGFYFVFLKSGGDAQLEILLGDGKSINIDLHESNKAQIDVILHKLFEDEKSTRLTKTLLKEYYSLYELDIKMVDSIRSEDPGSEYSDALRRLLFNLEGPFHRDYHTYYDVRSTSVLAGLRGNGVDHEVSKQLRLLARDNEPSIFPNASFSVQVSFPEGGNIQSGFAATCNGSKYIGRNVALRNPGNGAMIQVFVRNTFPCNGSERRLQLTSSDANNLFGDRVRKSHENAEMTVAQPGMKFDIVPVSI